MRFKSLLLLFFSSPCHSLYPKLLWKANLLRGRNIIDGGFRKGNALVLSKNQSDLWMTAGAGSLHVVRLLADNEHVVFKPTRLPNRTVESRSSIALYEGSPSTFAVYAVIDTPVDEIDQVNSRVICVDANNLLLWTTSVVGTIIGSPQITSDGKHIVVLHNLPTDGFVSVLSVQDRGNVVSQKPGNFLSPFGPSKLVTVNNVDFLYWGESTDGGYANSGKVMHMKVETPFDIHADFLVESSTVVPPTLSSDGSTMWLGGKDASVYSWKVTGNRGRIWKQQLPLSRRNATFPIVTQVEASGSRLFVASATNSFHCLNADNGKVLWSASSGPSIYLSSAKYSSKDNVVYSIQHLTGKVIQHHADTGDVLWHFDCVNVTGRSSCMDSVEAEPSLSRDGNMLYYGDIYGTVYALAVSDIRATGAPLNPPTVTPVTSAPTLPTLFPSRSPTTSPSSAPTNTISQQPLSTPYNVSIPTSSQSPSWSPTRTVSQPPFLIPGNLSMPLTSQSPTSRTLYPTESITQYPFLIPTNLSIPPKTQSPTSHPTKTASYQPSHISMPPTMLIIPSDILPSTTVSPSASQKQKEEVGQKAPITSSAISTIRCFLFSVSIATLAVFVV